jgi:MFS family permease
MTTRDAEHIGENLGRLASFEVAGFVLGPLVAALVDQLLGVRASFWFLTGVLLVVLGLTVRLDLAAGAVSTRRRAVRSLIAVPVIRATLAMSMAFYLTVGMFEAIWAVLLRDHGARTWLIGLTLSLFTVPIIFLAPLGGRAAQRRGPLRVVSVSLAVAALCTFSYGVLPSLWMLLAVSVVHAVADSFTMPGTQVAAALASPADQASSAQGLLGATGLAAAGLAGLLAGLLYQHLGALTVTATTATAMTALLVAARLLGGGPTTDASRKTVIGSPPDGDRTASLAVPRLDPGAPFTETDVTACPPGVGADRDATRRRH